MYYENDGNGNFTLDTIAHDSEYYGVQKGDMNNDGHMDIIVGTVGTRVYLNDGNGNFTLDNTLQEGGLTFSMETIDFDNDGVLELIQYNPSNLLKLIEIDGNGVLSHYLDIETQTGGDPYQIRAVDFNMDGHTDIYAKQSLTAVLV